MKLRIANLLFTVVSVLGFTGPAMAHPHIYIDGGIDFIFEDGKLTKLRVTWLYDAFYSLYLLQDAGLDTDGDGVLTEVEKVQLATRETSDWMDGYEGDSFLSRGETQIGLSRPVSATGDLVDGQVKIVFDRILEAPTEVGEGLTAKAFDPTYYVDYSITKTPEVFGSETCNAALSAFMPTGAIGALQSDLSSLGRDETPEMPNIGELFADRIELTCE